MKTGNRWFRLLLAMLILLFAGIIYAWSSISSPFSTEFGWAGASLKFNYTLTLIFFCLGGLASGLLAKRLSVRVRMLLSAALLCGGFAIVSRLSGTQIAWLYLAYGFMAGSGIGIVYNVVIAVTNAWFPDKKGLCSGCMMMTFGFSALLLGKLSAALFAAEAVGWRNTYLILGLAIGAVLCVAAFLLRLPRPDELPAVKPAARGASSVQDMDAKQMIARPSFWLLFAFFFLLASVGSTAIGAVGDIIRSLYPAEQAAEAGALTVTVVGVVSVCNGLGRLISGAVYDALGLRKTQWVTSLVAIAAPLLTLLASLLGSLPLGVAGLCLCGVSYGFSPTVTAAFASAFYGQKHFGLNFPILNLVLIPASFISTLTAWLNTATGSFTASFALLTAFSLLGLLVNMSIRKA